MAELKMIIAVVIGWAVIDFVIEVPEQLRRIANEISRRADNG